MLSLMLAVLLVLTLFPLSAMARSVADIDREMSETRNQMNELEGRAEALQAQMAETRGRLATLRTQEDSYLEELSVLQDELLLLLEQIELTEEQIALYKQMVAVKEERLEEAIEREEEQLALYRRRIRAMEERGGTSYIQLFLRAQSFSDLVARIHDAEEIISFDQRVGDQLERYRVSVQEYRDELQAEQAELEVLIARLEEEQAELEVLREEIEARISEVEARIAVQELELAELEELERRAAAELLRHTQNLGELSEARRQAIRDLEQGGGTGGGGGMGGAPARQGTGPFIWPSDHTGHVTSHFGPRWGGFHNGIDISHAPGAPNIDRTNVLAAASGYVSRAGSCPSFGNFIVINHGIINGNHYATLYAHNHTNLVRVGDIVTQGMIIARVGSTGNSTGPHIHFEIHRNGQRINPLQYFR